MARRLRDAIGFLNGGGSSPEPPPELKQFVFLRGFLNGDTARPFIVLATQNREVVRFTSSSGLAFFGTVSSTYVDSPGRYAVHAVGLNDVITAVGQVVDGGVTVTTAGSDYTISYEGYKPLEAIGTPPNRSYQPYTPQFVDM